MIIIEGIGRLDNTKPLNKFDQPLKRQIFRG